MSEVISHLPTASHQSHAAAFQKAVERLRANPPSLRVLGQLEVEPVGNRFRLRVLTDPMIVNLRAATVEIEGRGPADLAWGILVLHYLAASHPLIDARLVSLAELADATAYLTGFQQRLVKRFVETSGASCQRFESAARALGGQALPEFNCAWRFFVLPRVPITIIRYEGDDEFPPSAAILYQADAASLLPLEDRVVAIDLLLERLQAQTQEKE